MGGIIHQNFIVDERPSEVNGIDLNEAGNANILLAIILDVTFHICESDIGCVRLRSLEPKHFYLTWRRY